MNENQEVQIVWRQRFFLAFLSALVLAILTFLILLQSSQVWRYFQIETANDTLTLYALSSLNFIALVIFGFILLRSIVKLGQERRIKQLGAQIKTRLLVNFIAISILPLVAMATFSYLFLNRSLEKWFSTLPETVIREARGIQDSAIKSQADDLRNQAKMLSVVLENSIDANFIANRIIEKSGLSFIEITAPNNEILTRAEKNLSRDDKLEASQTLETAQKNPSDETLSDGRGFDAVSIYLNDGRRLIIVSDKYDNSIISQKISNSPLEFELLKESQNRVRQLGFSTLGLLTFLLLFAASWMALNLARNIAKPIKSLAEAADEIAKGNLSHRVEVAAQDELALLVSAFNAMTAQLQENRVKLEERRAYIETVLQSLSTGVISLDEKNRVTTINTAARDMLRLDESGCENCSLSEITSPLDFVTLEKLIAKSRRFGTATQQTLMLRENALHDSHSGELSGLSVALTATALRGNIENRREVVLVIEDLSELLTAQRAAAWQEVAKRMAHEIKNPLTPIQLAAERISKNVSSFKFQVSSVASGFQPTNNLQPETWNL
ncbi:MAG: HAMP domain-containing protein, partial [Pyrinomonadaceae bacterium]|nr:HAMP domain-containing protein [Pyrinomonadaceae bacterium]